MFKSQPKFPTVLRRCKIGHTIMMTVAPWWFDVNHCKCGECGESYTEMKWYGLCSVEEAQDMLPGIKKDFWPEVSSDFKEGE